MAVFKTHEEMATGTQRIIFHCKNRNCKCVWAYDYLIIPVSTKRVNYLRHNADGKRVWSSDEYFDGCPDCHSLNIQSNLVVGKASDHVCDARCMRAKGPVCECSCAGANHGAGFLRQQ